MTWIKSSFCKADQPMCVEVNTPASGDVGYLVRSSREPGDVIAFTTDEWAAFIAGVKNGDFD